jgi:hypothetical protein
VEKDLKGDCIISVSQLWRYYFRSFQVRTKTRRIGKKRDIKAYKDALWESINPREKDAAVSAVERTGGRASEEALSS